MNFVSKFNSDLTGDGSAVHSGAQGHFETFSSHATHVPADAIIIPDPHLLFTADFKRTGVDLVLSGDGRELVLHDYFKGEKRAPLSSPDGAHLTGDIVNALAGQVEYAQADGTAGVGHVIGHVSKLAGTATAIRNGVSIILNNGENVEKGDVIQAGSETTVTITFIDGTVFGLSSNARMVLNEMVYDPNGSSNSSLLSLVTGTISFVAGETAKHGDMKINTPVATMGIRGTAGVVEILEIDFKLPASPVAPTDQGAPPDPNLTPDPNAVVAPTVNFRLLVEPDGTSGSYVLFEPVTMTPMAVVNLANLVTSISQGTVTTNSSPLSQDALKIISDVFAVKFAADTTNPRTTTALTDSIFQELGPLIKLASGQTVIPTVLVLNTTDRPASSNPNAPSSSHDHIDRPVDAAAFGSAFVERAGLTHSSLGDTVSGVVNYADINSGDVPFVTVDPKVTFSYQDAHHNEITLLNPLQQADIAAVEVALVVVQDPNQKNLGTATWTYTVPDHAFDFLAEGETLTLTYTAHVDNNFAPNHEITDKTFTIVVTGTNDVPVITTGPESVAFSGGKTTPGGNLQTTIPGAPTTGSLAFTDVDLTDTHTVSTKLTDASLTGPTRTLDETALDTLAPTPMAAFETALSALIASGSDSTGTGSGTINWKLADLPVWVADFINPGETLTLTYTVTVKDSQNTISTQTVTVTIDGTASAAVVWIDTKPAPPGGALWSDPQNWETGTVPTATDDAIIITDQLQGLVPTYPVTVNDPAVAKTVTMNDFGHTAPELDNNSTLTIGDKFDLINDAIVKNSNGATITVGGKMEVADSSQLANSGTLILGQGGDFRDTSGISNTLTGAIEVTGGTLNVLVDVANSGHITVHPSATLTLNGAAIDGGTVTNDGTLDLTGSGVLKNGTLDNSHQINASSTGNELDNETVTNTGNIDVSGELLVDPSTIDNAGGGSITVEGTGTLTLDGASIKNGTLGNSGQIDVSGSGNELDKEAVTNTGGIEVVTGGALLVDLVSTVDNTLGTITVDGTGTLTLNQATVTAGVVTDKTGGEVDLTGAAVLQNGVLGNSGLIKVSNSGNELLGETVTNTGGIEVVAGGALLIDPTTIDNTLGTITVDGTGTLTLNQPPSPPARSPTTARST